MVSMVSMVAMVMNLHVSCISCVGSNNNVTTANNTNNYIASLLSIIYPLVCHARDWLCLSVSQLFYKIIDTLAYFKHLLNTSVS